MKFEERTLRGKRKRLILEKKMKQDEEFPKRFQEKKFDFFLSVLMKPDRKQTRRAKRRISARN